MTQYPEKILRGISSAQGCVSKEGYAMAAAFLFDKKGRGEDGYCELSINWYDDEGALTTLLNQRKPFNATPQFKVGYCELNRSLVDLMLKQYLQDGHFKYERRPIIEDKVNDIQENPYHGNFLMIETLDNNIRKNIQHSLATLAGVVAIRNDLQSD